MKVLYLTWGEVVTNNGLFNNQVLEQLKEIRAVDASVSIKILSGIPLINQSYLKHRRTFLADIERIRSELSIEGLEFYYRWILVIARWFHSQFYQFPFYTFNQYTFFKNFVVQHQIDIVHCRGYHATRLAMLVKRKFDLHYKIIFDTRGLFPEEGVFAKYYSLSSRSYETWKAVENKLLDGSDAVVNVTDTFTQHIKSITTNQNIHTIYTTTNLNIFNHNPITRSRIREQLSISTQEKVLVYSGSISQQSWHRISTLIVLFQVFQKVFVQSKLLIITRSSHSMLIGAFNQAGILATSYIITSANSPAEVNTLLQAADYAVLPYRPVFDELERVIGHTMIASKTGEYFAVGLPLIVNEAVGAAAQMVKERCLGCVYKIREELSIKNCLLEIDTHYADVQQRCIAAAQDYFDAAGNARKYIRIYKELMAATHGNP